MPAVPVHMEMYGSGVVSEEVDVGVCRKKPSDASLCERGVLCNGASGRGYTTNEVPSGASTSNEDIQREYIFYWALRRSPTGV